jgi:hypothetical protein
MLYFQLRCNVLSVAYRGFSESEGSPNEEGIKKDADVRYLYVYVI